MGKKKLVLAALLLAMAGWVLPQTQTVPWKSIPSKRPPVILLHPMLKITSMSVDTKARTISVEARNTGGPMTQDATVILYEKTSEQTRQLFEKKWPKGKESVGFFLLLFDNFESPSGVCTCTRLGSWDVWLRAEVHGPDVNPQTQGGWSKNIFYPARQDLAVAGFQWHQSGALTFQVGNNGECPSLAWSYRLYVEGNLVETSGRFGTIEPGDWTQHTASYKMNKGGLCHFKVEVVPETPALEKNITNNAQENYTMPY